MALNSALKKKIAHYASFPQSGVSVGWSGPPQLWDKRVHQLESQFAAATLPGAPCAIATMLTVTCGLWPVCCVMPLPLLHPRSRSGRWSSLVRATPMAHLTELRQLTASHSHASAGQNPSQGTLLRASEFLAGALLYASRLRGTSGRLTGGWPPRARASPQRSSRYDSPTA